MKNIKNFEVFFLILFCLILTISSKYDNNAKTSDNLALVSDIYRNPIVQLSKLAPSSFDKPIMLAINSPSTPYRVTSGNTLWDVASNHNTNVEQLIAMNKLNSDTLSFVEKFTISEQAPTAPISSRQQTPTPSRSAEISQAETILQTAANFYHTPYRWGGSTPSGFDCSGFVQYVFGKNGYKLPRTAAAQSSVGIHVDKSDLMPGDLVFFAINGSGISHVGIYEGNGSFIHSSTPYAGGVIYSSMSESSYSRSYVGARRLLR